MAETRVWVHGIAVEARFPLAFPESLSLQERTEAGAFFSTSGSVVSHSFYLSFPSPTILNDFSMRLRRVFIRYETNGATIKRVRIFDGPTLVADFPNLIGWSGNHNNGFDASNQLIFSPQSISNSILIVVEVDFDGPSFNKTIRFSSAGIQLFTDELLRPIIRLIMRFFERLFEPRP